MKTILLSIIPELIYIFWFTLLVAFGVIWSIIKTTPNLDDNIKETNININIQKINKIGYNPEEDDEITGYEYAEKPHVEKNGGYINEHLKSVINEK